MSFRPAQRLQNLPGQLFARLVRTARELQAAGLDVINLGQGNPDQPAPPHVVERLVAEAARPENHRYPPFSGLPELKAAISAWYERRFGVRVDPEREVCILIGAKLGLQEISLALLDEGDYCLMPDPGYPDYWSGVALAGAVLHPMPLLAERGFFPDFGAIAAPVRERAKLMFLNSPANPTGSVASRAQMEEAVAFCREHRIALAWDSAYCDLVFDGRAPASFLQVPGAREVGLEFHTFSKSFNMAGWRLAFAAGNADLIGMLNLIQDHLNCSQFAPVQLAGAAALLGPTDSVEALRRLYQERRDAFVAGCRAVGWPVIPPAGSFFVWCPVPAGHTSASFADLLLEKAHVVVAPGHAFGSSGEGYVRVSLCVPAERLTEATRRIGSLGVFGR